MFPFFLLLTSFLKTTCTHLNLVKLRLANFYSQDSSIKRGSIKFFHPIDNTIYRENDAPRFYSKHKKTLSPVN